LEEKVENKNQNVAFGTLSKYWKTSYEMPAIYTGGRIMFSMKKKQIFSISNFTIFIFDYETKETIKKITHVSILRRKKNNLKKNLKENEEISNFTFNQQENILVTFTKNYLVRTIDMQTYDTIKTIKVYNFYKNTKSKLILKKKAFR